MEWIRCSERMPEEDAYVITHWPEARGHGPECVSTAYWVRRKWRCVMDKPLRQDVTHWMPLPSFPPSDPLA